jgi:phytoene dehydrogenase-like protein
MWDELGALDGRQIVHNDTYLRVEMPDGSGISLPTDINALEHTLKTVSPQDSGIIDELIKACRIIRRFDMPVDKAPELMHAWDLVKFLVRFFPLLKTFGIWNRISIGEFAERFRHPLLRQAFREFFVPGVPMIFAIMVIGWLHNRNAGYPLGGSLEFSRGIERRYLALGGEVTYRAKVGRIIVENGRAVGVRLEDGSEHRADYILSAADGHATIFKMLEGRYVDRAIRSYYDNLPTFPSLVHVALGVNRALDDFPRCIEGFTLPLARPIIAGPDRHDRLWVHIYNFDPTLAPPGKTVVKALLPADHAYWKKLRDDPDRYAVEKERIGSEVIAALDRRFPGLASRVEMMDVASPTTFVRYTGNWKGSIEGWIPVPSAGGLRLQISKSLPGLDRFYMTGQWVEPGGGVPAAALSGRNVIQLVCRDERRRFSTRTG